MDKFNEKEPIIKGSNGSDDGSGGRDRSGGGSDDDDGDGSITASVTIAHSVTIVISMLTRGLNFTK